MSDTPRTITLGELTCEVDEPAPRAADVAVLREIVDRLLEARLADLAREQARVLRHARERALLLERVSLIEEQLAALMVAEHRR
jgi:hypothetical protein